MRTFHTCKPQQEEVGSSGSDRPLYWEFLSDPKLLNTAITRARCLVAVVGDPVSLCTVGECRSIWRDYIKRCNEKGGLYGVTMEELDKEINAAIASIELNPKAEPFVPKSPSMAEQSVNTEIAETRKVENNKEISKEPQTEQIDEEVKAKGPDISAEDSQNVNYRCSGSNFIKDSSDSSQDKSKKDEVDEEDEEDEEDDEDDEERVVEPGDFQDDLLDDETVSPRDLDEIILAFVKKCEETLQLDVARRSMFQDSEFPPLDATGSKGISSQTDANWYRFSVQNTKEISQETQNIEIDEEVKAKGPDIAAVEDGRLLEDSQNVNNQFSGSKFYEKSPDSNQEKNKKDEVVVEDDEERVVEPGDFQDDHLEDETVSPRGFDEIMLAFVKKREETFQLDVARESMFEDSEFPPLRDTGSKEINAQKDESICRSSIQDREDINDFFPEIRVINGRVEVRLTNLGFYNSPSERVQRIIACTKQQEFLDSSVLLHLLSDEPDKYKVCNLRLNPEKFETGYAEIEDTETPDIEIRGRVRRAFDRDKVVLELTESKSPSHAESGEVRFQGMVVGKF